MVTEFLDKAAIDSIIVQQLRVGLVSLDSKQPESVISVYLHQSSKYLLSLDYTLMMISSAIVGA